MIEIDLPSCRPKPKYTYHTPTYHTPPPPASTLIPTIQDIKTDKPYKEAYQEAMRRDHIIKELVRASNFKIGDPVKILSDAGRSKYGEQIHITKIVESYAMMGVNEEWPGNDNPMVIHCYSKDKDIHFFCTTSYITKL